MQLALVVFVAALLPNGAKAGAATNPFKGQKYYVNPGNSKEFDGSIATATGKVKENLKMMQKVPSAYWIDVAEKIKGSSMQHMEGILKDAASKPTPELVVLIWYDLPNRDCDAKASNGQICCTYADDGRCDYMAEGDCAEGIEEYKTTYVDPFVEVLGEYQDKLPIVIIMEPDSLPNIATNTAHPKCGNPATGKAYKAGVKYALDQLTSKAPKVTVYLDAAHGGWVGWENNMLKFMKMLKGMDLPMDKVRGFATNVANYQPLGIQCPWCPDQGYRNGFCLNNKHQSHPCCEDPCKLSKQYNFGNNELNYAAGLIAAANGELSMDAHVVIDTGRNGIVDQREDCANWCNPRGAGAGIPSTAETANSSLVDAYYWLKTPGESDGCSQTLPNGKACPRFDAGCASVDSLGEGPDEEPAPEAGRWYDFQVKQLAKNARFQGSASMRAAAEHPDDAKCEAVPPPPPPQQTPWSSSGGSSSGRVSAFNQCGGKTWTGPSTCEDGCKCQGNDDYYHQCVPLIPGGSCALAAVEADEEKELGSLPTQPPTQAPQPQAAVPSTSKLMQGLVLPDTPTLPVTPVPAFDLLSVPTPPAPPMVMLEAGAKMPAVGVTTGAMSGILQRDALLSGTAPGSASVEPNVESFRQRVVSPGVMAAFAAALLVSGVLLAIGVTTARRRSGRLGQQILWEALVSRDDQAEASAA